MHLGSTTRTVHALHTYFSTAQSMCYHLPRTTPCRIQRKWAQFHDKIHSHTASCQQLLLQALYGMSCIASRYTPQRSLNNCCKSHWFRPPWHPGWPHKKSNWVQYTSEPLGRHSGCNKLSVPSDLLTLTKACLQNRTYPPSPLVEPCSQHHTSNRLQSHSEAGDQPVFAVRCLQTSMKEQQAAAAAGAATTTTTTAATTAPQHLDALHHNRPIRWPEHGAVKCGR